MQVLYPRCCALDVHKVVSCLRLADVDKVTSEVLLAERSARRLVECRAASLVSA
jgi:hypothetical protein